MRNGAEEMKIDNASVLTDRGSFCKGSMSRTDKDILRRVNIAVVSCTAIRAIPLPYSEVCDTFRTLRGYTTTRRTDSGRESFIYFHKFSPVRNRFVAELISESRPSYVIYRFCHRCFFKTGGVHIPVIRRRRPRILGGGRMDIRQRTVEEIALNAGIKINDLKNEIRYLTQERDSLKEALEKFDVEEYVNAYEVRGDDGDYTPNDDEKFYIKDALAGAISDILEDWKALSSHSKPDAGVEG